MEGIAVAAAVVLLLIIFSEKSGKGSEYTIEQSPGNQYYEVKDQSGNTVFAGTKPDCEQWVEDHS